MAELKEDIKDTVEDTKKAAKNVTETVKETVKDCFCEKEDEENKTLPMNFKIALVKIFYS